MISILTKFTKINLLETSVAPILLIEGMSGVWHVPVSYNDTTPAHVITLNCVIFSTYYQWPGVRICAL